MVEVSGSSSTCWLSSYDLGTVHGDIFGRICAPTISETTTEMSFIGYNRDLCLVLTTRLDLMPYLDMPCLAFPLSLRVSDEPLRVWKGIVRRLQHP